MSQFTLSRRQCLASLLAAWSLPALSRATAGTGRRDVPWLADVQRPPGRLPDDAPRLAPLLVDDQGGKITTLEGWWHSRGAHMETSVAGILNLPIRSVQEWLDRAN